MNRRNFLRTLAISGIGLAGSYFYLYDEKMERAKKRNGKIIADLHSHPSSNKTDEETLEMLCSPGLVGLTCYQESFGRILTYEDAMRRFSNYIEEIDKGMLAKITTALGEGYFTRTQEIYGDFCHILALGFEGEYLQSYEDPRKAVEAIHKNNGLAILNHPYVRSNDGSIVRFRFINNEEERIVKELCEMVDEVEIFNACCINPTGGIFVPNFKKANEAAEVLAEDFGFRGTVSSDAHYVLEQPKITGIYIDEENLCIEKLKEDIKTGNFDNSYRKYVSRYSFLRGFFLKG